MQQETFQIRQIIGENIREGRRRLEVTQEEFAEAVDLSVQSVSSLENGMKFARMDTYFKIAETLELPIHLLFSEQLSQDNILDGQHHLLFYDCKADEKKALIKIMAEIKILLRKQQSSLT